MIETNYKTVRGFLNHLAALSKDQDMSDCTDWDKLTEDQKSMFYGIIAGIQNDLGELSSSLTESGFFKKSIW